MSQSAAVPDFAQLSDQLEQITAEVPGATVQVLAFASKEQLTARAVKAQEDAFAEACAAVWEQVADSPDELKQRVRAGLDTIMEIVEDWSDAAAAAARKQHIRAPRGRALGRVAGGAAR